MMQSWDDPNRPILGMNMDGGRPCLDLLNTLLPADAAAPLQLKKAQDLLTDYLDFTALAVRTALLPAEEANALEILSARKFESPQASLKEAKALRTLLHKLLMKGARSLDPLVQELAMFEELRVRARSFEMLVWEDGRYRLRPRYQAEGLAAPFNAFVRDADDLLRGPDLSRVRVLRSHSPHARFILG